MKYKALLLTSCIALTAHAEPPSLKPNNMEAFNNFADIVIQDEKRVFLEAGQSGIGVGLPVVSAGEVIADYKANELKGNKKYKGKDVRLKTVASAIKEGIANKPYITANGKNQFEHIIIYINPDEDRFLEISKGDKIDLICKGDGVVMESPVFKNCVFPTDYADAKTKEIKATAVKYIESDTFPATKDLPSIVVLLYKGFEPDVEQSCLKGSDDCNKAFKSILNNKVKMKKVDERSKPFDNMFKSES